MKKKKLVKIVKKFKSDSIYDCIAPVSGGKDGSYVGSKIRDELGLNPLTVTSRPPLELDVGKKVLKNFLNMDMTMSTLHQIIKLCRN